ncbi:MAG: extracellular solute-binding protein [Spirochaetaceae bacterium]|jgi:putative aldouronate transport system substrate-binding protein|nr:extracellular solute-binding protein [Spirochaetaceae bacterium]
MKKNLGFAFLTLALMALLLAGCGKGNAAPAQAPAAGSARVGTPDLPLVDKPATLSVWLNLGQIDPSAGITTLNDVLSWQVIEEKTGIHIDWIHPPAGQDGESFNLMIASGDYPDIIVNTGDALYSGGMDTAITDGVYIRLNELVEQYAPNYKELRTRTPEVARDTLTDQGNIGGFYSINTPNQGPWYGMAVRQDWLDDLGLATPVTYDDWYTMLTAFKEKKGASAPLWIMRRGGDLFSVFSAGYGITGPASSMIGSFFQVDGKVKYSPLEPGYREYVAMLAKWYREDLIDKDYYTRNDYFVPDTLANTGRSGAFPDIYVMIPLHPLLSEDKNINVVAIPAPVKNAGDRLHLRQYNFEWGNFSASVTAACKDPVLAVRWLDYLCSDEGSLIMGYGVEGDTFEYVDGKPRPTDKILNNPDGLNVAAARTKYVGGQPCGKYYWERELAGAAQSSLDAINTVWPSNADGAYMMPNITMTAEESGEFSRIMGDVDTYAMEMTTKFIIGSEPLSRYDEFTGTIRSMGAENAVAIMQTALDRYYRR